VVLANVMMACGGLLYVWVDAPGPLAVLARCLQGMASALLYAHGTVLVADLVPRNRLPSAIALYMTAGLVPNVISPPAVEWLLAHQGPDLVFAAAGILALVGAILALRLPDQVPAPSTRDAVPNARPTAAFMAVSALFGLAAGITFTFHQPLALERGAQRVSDFLITFTVTATVLRLAGGRFIDRLGSARVAVWSATGYALVMLAFAAPGPVQLALLGVCFGATHGLFFPTFVALVLHHGPDAGRETRMAWIGACDKFGYLLVIPLGPARGPLRLCDPLRPGRRPAGDGGADPAAHPAQLVTAGAQAGSMVPLLPRDPPDARHGRHACGASTRHAAADWLLPAHQPAVRPS
jgi:MFS family permease